MASPTSQDQDTLSVPATLLYRLGLPLVASTLYLYSPATALTVPFVAAPTAVLLYQRSQLPSEKKPASLETLIWAFLSAATVAPAISILAQSVLSYGAAKLFFGSQTSDYIAEFTRSGEEVRQLSSDAIETRAGMARSWPYLAYLTLFSFSMAGLPEEGIKYGILRLIERRHRRQTGQQMKAGDYLVYARAIGLGFSFFENLAFIYVAATKDTRNMLLVTAAERILYGTAAHVLTCVLTALRMARSSAARESDADKTASAANSGKNWYRAILPSMLYHGAGDALLLAACAYDGHPGWVHPETVGSFLKYAIAPVLLMAGLGMQVSREMKTLGVTWVGT